MATFDSVRQDVNKPPSVCITDYKLEAVHQFAYLGSAISDTLSLDTKLNRRISKVATILARLAKHVWANRKLTEHTKVQVYMVYVVSTLLYVSETWTLCFDLLKVRCLCWLGHVTRMDDGRIPKDLLYGELASGKRPTGHPQLRFKDT